MFRKIIGLIAGLAFVAGLSAEAFQDLKTVAGVVSTFKTIPLNKVRIFAEKSGETVFTDSSGVFSIRCAPKDLLIISAAGFHERKIRTGNEGTYKVDLAYTDNESNFKAATGRGHISADILRQSILTMASKNQKDYSKYKTIFELISTEIYNVRVKGNSVVNTKVRSFDANPQVLYVVNGVITSDISYISPDYVKDIEFIDDVYTTLYGSKGANGVLKITLK